MITRFPSPPRHAAFRTALDPVSARHQMRMSIGVVAALMVAIGLGASSIAPQSGWATAPATVSAAQLSQHSALRDPGALRG